MTEVFEQGVASSRRSRRASGTAAAAAEAALHNRLVERDRRRAGSATWSSTLNAQDLACLLSVIERQLLPSLIRSYRPAKRKPLNGSGVA